MKVCARSMYVKKKTSPPQQEVGWRLQNVSLAKCREMWALTITDYFLYYFLHAFMCIPANFHWFTKYWHSLLHSYISPLFMDSFSFLFFFSWFFKLKCPYFHFYSSCTVMKKSKKKNNFLFKEQPLCSDV